MIKKILLSIVLLSLLILPTGLDYATQRGQAESPVLLGIYPSGSIGQTAHEINQLDTYLGGNKISIAGGFSDFEFPDSWITSELEAAWNNGYWPLINIGAGTMDDSDICPNDPDGNGDTSDEIECTAAKIASGDLDPAIQNWAQLFKAWSDNGTKRAYLAPLQEMNGEWVDYFGDPTNYKAAYTRIQDIFAAEGVDPDSVVWVFAPNGWSKETSDNFENYYPGDSAVDVVGFSSFNWGTCWDTTTWQTYTDIYEPYLDRMAAMAPDKPIFILEMASVTVDGDRAQWFDDALTGVGNYPGVGGVLYFNRWEDPWNQSGLNPDCDHDGDGSNGIQPDYSLDFDGAEGKAKFKEEVTQSPFTYWAPGSKRTRADFDGDNDTDVSVYRPSNGKWYVYGGSPIWWGLTGDLPVPGDYDGDGTTDIAVFRPSNGKWYVYGEGGVWWGMPNDVPIQGDYDNDGATEIAVYRPSNGKWYVYRDSPVWWGMTGDIPVPGDYDGNGSTDIAVYRPSNGKWYVYGEAGVWWGMPGDIPVPGDYDGDGSTDIAVYRPSNGKWFVYGEAGVWWGMPDDIPVPGDYDGDGDTDIAVLRPSNGKWYIKDQMSVWYHMPGDYPLPVRDTNADGDPYH